MKKLFIVANWKSYKTQTEAADWLERFKETEFALSEIDNKEIIICPQFPLLPLMSDLMAESQANEKLLLRLGSQNISAFEEGAFTGEVTGKLLSEFCAYTLIGHSERRKHLGETDELLAKKVITANEYNITPIFCIQNKETIIPKGVNIVAFEPIEAIGTGNPDSPEDAEFVAKFVKENNTVNTVLYGGSVNESDVKAFTSMEHIDGVLVGGASRDPEKFAQIIKNA